MGKGSVIGDIMITNDIDEGMIKNLEEKAKKIRRHVIDMIYEAKSGHVGGSLSCIDILTVLYFHILKHDPKDPNWEDRDRFILSKGHSAPALYAILAEVGYFPIEELKTLRKLGSRLQGHPDLNFNLPGIEVSSGSLGQGLSIVAGIALSAKLDKKKFKTYVLLGDGELDEGQIWESIMFASHYKLNNLIAIIDRNLYQIDGPTEKIMSLKPLEDKFTSFNWDVYICNGNDIKELIDIFEKIKFGTRPIVIIANTIKGKGVSFIENNNSWHGKAPNKQEMENALKELEK